MFSIKRFSKYLRIIFNKRILIVIILTSIISNSILIYKDREYCNLYQEKEYEIYGEVVSNKKEKEYKDMYKLKVQTANESRKYNNTYVYISVDKKKELKYGDYIRIKGSFVKGEVQRNYGGFNYNQYLRTLKIHGTIKVNNLKVINNKTSIFSLTNKLANEIESRIGKFIENKEIVSICKGIILGNTEEIEENIKENFRITNISHILAVSGLHVTYIITGINIVLKNLIGKNKTNIIIILVLIIYMFITGFTPSIVRAGIMGILISVSHLIYRKNDTWNSMAISLLILLIYNPYYILNIGLQLSYLGTIGILIFNKNINKAFEQIRITKKNIKIKTNKRLIKIIEYVKETLSITLSAQIMIFPIMIYHFNILGIYFFITNLLVSIIIGPIIILTVIIIIMSYINIFISKAISIILVILVNILIQISNISKLPFSKLYVPTPSTNLIITYYIFVLSANRIYQIYVKNMISNTELRIKNMISLAKYKINEFKKQKISKKLKYKIIIMFTISIFIVILIPQKTKVHFIDVGQGDSSFIETNKRETILIDGGGTINTSFDVGKKTLLPYILDRGYTKIDNIFITHTDYDHIGGILTLLEEIKVKQVFIGKQAGQAKEADNYKKLIKILEEKDIKLIELKKGDIFNIGNIKFEILWPQESEHIEENEINNNSLVMRVSYKNFSMLFTGDIEEIAEQKILEEYKEEEKLKAHILKVAHHRI